MVRDPYLVDFDLQWNVSLQCCILYNSLTHYGLVMTSSIMDLVNIDHFQVMAYCLIALTHWGRVTHICVSKLTIIGSDNGLSPDQRQATTWTNDGILSTTGPLRNKAQWNINRNSYIFIQENASENVVWKMAAMLSRPQCVKWLPEAMLTHCQLDLQEQTLKFQSKYNNFHSRKRISTCLQISSHFVDAFMCWIWGR